jgi:hypothetical protein
VLWSHDQPTLAHLSRFADNAALQEFGQLKRAWVE